MSASWWCDSDSMSCPEPRCRAPWDRTVIEGLLKLEKKYLPSHLYVSLIQEDPEMREALVQWTLGVCCQQGCGDSVFPLAVSLLDNFLSVSQSLPVSPLCLTAACLLLATKLLDKKAVSADALCIAARFAFLPHHLRDMESIVLATLHWDIAAVTPHEFLPHFLSALKESKMAGNTESLLAFLRAHSSTLAALCVCETRFLGTPPSVIAAVAVNRALQVLGVQGEQLVNLSSTLAGLCKTDVVIVQHFSKMIENITTATQMIGQKELEVNVGIEDEAMETSRASTPTDLRDIHF